MIPLRSDVHNLFDSHEIGVDIHDDYRVISFSEGREDLAGCHLKIDLVDTLYRPLPELLTDHLTQGVWRCCVFPGWKHDNQQLPGSLDLVPEAIEGMFDDESQEDDPADTAASLAVRLRQLDLESRGGRGGMPRAYAPMEQFSMKQREYGKGKAAFEGYLAASLSVWNDTVPRLWGYTEED